MLSDKMEAQADMLWNRVRKVAEMPGVKVSFGCHDEILFECRDDQVEAVTRALLDIGPLPEDRA